MAKVVRYGERVNLNNEVIPFLRSNLQRGNRRIGVLVAWMYVEIRLLTLISHAMKSATTEISEIQTLLEDVRLGLGSGRTIFWARKLGTISSTQKGDLTKLVNLRNAIAQEKKLGLESLTVQRGNIWRRPAGTPSVS